MEQQFQLKYYGRFDLFEQAQMTSEERAWMIRRIDKENKDKQEREKQQMGNIKRPSMSKPSVPRIR
jgi:hypothetical protein